MQLAALGVTLAIAIVGGTITGFILKGCYNILKLIFCTRTKTTPAAKTLVFFRF